MAPQQSQRDSGTGPDRGEIRIGLRGAGKELEQKQKRGIQHKSAEQLCVVAQREDCPALSPVHVDQYSQGRTDCDASIPSATERRALRFSSAQSTPQTKPLLDRAARRIPVKSSAANCRVKHAQCHGFAAADCG